MVLMRLPLIVTSLLISVISPLSSSFAAPIKPHFPNSEILPPSTRIGLVAKSPSSTLLYQNKDMLFPPASTLKLVTALAAKLELGDTFRYTTQLEKEGNNLILRFSGDPSLTTKDLEKLFDQAEIKQIKGDLIIDQTAFTGYEKGVGWPWDILGVCYSTPSSAISVDGNCVMASIYTNANGTTRVFTPPHQPVVVSTNAKAVTRQQQKDRYCDLDLSATQTNHYQLSGCLVKQDNPLPLNFAVQNPFLYSSAILHNTLEKKGIKLAGTIKLAPQPSTFGKPVAFHHSEPLPVLLEHMLKDSDNLYANNLSKTLGAHYFKQAGSFKNGTEAIKQILKKKAKINLEDSILEDGSGLSRNNRMTPQQMYSILKYIKAQDHKLNLIILMPKSGENGTLKYRSSMTKAPVKGQVIAKSGSLFATHNMAGFVLDELGAPSTIFVQYITDYHPQKNTNLISPLTRFEQELYQNLIKSTKE